MSKRFLAVLAVLGLAAGSAMVGLTMASGSWTVVGDGLAPGEGYALFLNTNADRIKFELANVTSDPVATFSVWAPSGERAGFYQLDGSTKAAEIVVTSGVWMIMVYKAQGGDLTLSTHGASDNAGIQFVAATLQRKEITLGQQQSQGPLDQTFTAMLNREPALAGVYLRGSARNFQSELHSEKGVVEVVNDEQVSAAAGMVVDAKGQRSTIPNNLAKGAYTAKVHSDSFAGTIVLQALYLVAPDVSEVTPAEPAPTAPPNAPRAPRAPPSPHTAHSVAVTSAMSVADCGEASPQIPYALKLERPGVLHLALGEEQDPWVTIFDPADQIVKVVQLAPQSGDGRDSTGAGHGEKKAKVEEVPDHAEVPLSMVGEYVLYARGATVKVSLMGAKDCELRELSTEPIDVATYSANLIGGSGPDESKGGFAMPLAPLEFGVRLNSPDTVVTDLNAVFTGPDGDAATVHESFSTGLIGGGFMLPFGPGGESPQHGPRHASGTADVAPDKMLSGDWFVDFQSNLSHGEIVAYALVYVRDAGEAEE